MGQADVNIRRKRLCRMFNLLPVLYVLNLGGVSGSAIL